MVAGRLAFRYDYRARRRGNHRGPLARTCCRGRRVDFDAAPKALAPPRYVAPAPYPLVSRRHAGDAPRCSARIVAREAPKLTIEVDSAGTAGYHVGDPPDNRTREAALRRGYDMSALRARVVEPQDFLRFDLILAMDQPYGGELRVEPDAFRLVLDKVGPVDYSK